ncbi:putative acyclic terpene utilization [Lupinus albus]|uniref:Putative acyclic terpene utilization n=1 Tax=Lupinus albus TaxID=3870 RepID=A0A6A4QQP6_LUPAL|nr:putative acyclic terpene utilization [Lupinus albus]
MEVKVMKAHGGDEINNCLIKLRSNPERLRDKVYIGCGAGFGGDRPLAALKLLQRVKELNYLVLECLAERTLADRYQIMLSGGHGYDSHISNWMRTVLPLALERGTCIITNMGAMDPLGAQQKVLEVASSLGLSVSVAVAHEVSLTNIGSGFSSEKSYIMEGGISTYLGAAPIVRCLEKYQPNVIITSRLADAALFLAPMVYELGWNWDELVHLAQGSLAGHLLECGCQLTGGYFMHPGDKYRDMSFPQLLDLSLPYAEISFDGQVCVAKAEGSGGILNFNTCAEQLLYEVGDPGAYVTPDVVIDFQDVSFLPLSSCRVLCIGAKPSSKSIPDKLLQLVPKDCGWKGWGEISYGGYECVKRAKAAEYLVRSWMEEIFPGLNDHILSYIIGFDSLKAFSNNGDASSLRTSEDIRLRMDGLFEQKEHAVQFSREFTALYTNGPAGGGGISTGYKKEILLEKLLVRREDVFWRTAVRSNTSSQSNKVLDPEINLRHTLTLPLPSKLQIETEKLSSESVFPCRSSSPALHGMQIPLYNLAHSRAGDKGNDINFSLIPYFPSDVERLKLIITSQWVKSVLSPLLALSTSLDELDARDQRDKWVNENVQVEIYEVKGIQSLNIVVRNILDGGVNCSRRIDRHGKTISDIILCQQVVMPP